MIKVHKKDQRLPLGVTALFSSANSRADACANSEFRLLNRGAFAELFSDQPHQTVCSHHAHTQDGLKILNMLSLR